MRKAVEKVAFCRDWRNKHIAHRDLERILSEFPSLRERVYRNGVQDALESIIDVLNAVSLRYLKSTNIFGPLLNLEATLPFLEVLDAGVQYLANRRARLEKGEFIPEDIEHRDL